MKFLPPPIVIGCVNDAPAPVLEIVSGVEVTTEVSVVGKLPDAGKGLALTPETDDAAGAVVDETTDVSSVGNRGGALLGACNGRWLWILWKPRLAGEVRLLQRSLLIFHLLLQRFHCLHEGLHLPAQRFHVRCGSRRCI